ncbi:O-antigen ligase family protein [Primorskyibacter sp. S187A]|uniref:O-antigen ligase family protein n=1 Tax=Primorskyibacter sp. S187A TaxID=3415130 RepID=UPI003C7DFC46
MRRLIKALSQSIGAMLLGAFAGLLAVAGGTKAVVIVPAVAMVTAFVLWPYSGLYAVIATIPVNVELVGPITVSRLAILLGLLAIMVQAAKRQVPMPRLSIWPEGTLALAFFCWVILATLIVGGGGYVGKLGPWIIFAIILFVLLNYVDTQERLRSVFVLLAIMGGLQGLFVLSQAYLGFSPFGGWHATLAADQADGEIRVAGTSSHPIILAGFFQTAIGATVCLLLIENKALRRFLWLGCLAFAIWGWWFTFARSSWIGSSMMVFAGLFFMHPATRRLAVIAGIFIFVVLAIFDFSPGAIIRFIESFGSVQAASSTAGVAEGSESLSWRTENWSGAFRIFLQHPILGIGIDASKAAMLANLPQGAIAHQFISAEVPHNLFLLLLAELGIVSFALFIGMLVMAFRGLWRACGDPQLRPYAVAVAAIFLGQLTTFFFNPIPREIWLSLGLSLAISRMGRAAVPAASRKGRAPMRRPKSQAPKPFQGRQTLRDRGRSGQGHGPAPRPLRPAGPARRS